MNPKATNHNMKYSKLLLTILLSLLIVNSFWYNSPINNFHLKSNSQPELEGKTHQITMNVTKAFSENSVWSQPQQVTFPALEHGEYIIRRDSTGLYHCIFIKHLSLYGYSLNYMKSDTNTTAHWGLPQQFKVMDSTIENLQLVLANNTLYLAFIARREIQNEVVFLFKNIESNHWSNITTISRSLKQHYSSLTMELAEKNVLDIAWVSTKKETESNEVVSAVQLVRIFLPDGTISTPLQLFKEYSPLKIRLRTFLSGVLGAIIVTWDGSFEGNELYMAASLNDGISWENISLLDTYDVPIDELHVFKSNLTKGFHILWTADDVTKELVYLEVFANGSINTPQRILNNPNYNAFIAGIVEDELTNDLYVFYEEDVSAQMNILYKKRFGDTQTWQISEAITTTGKATNPLFIPSYSHEAGYLGDIFFFDLNILVTMGFNKSGDLSSAEKVLFTTVENNEGSIVVDQEGVIHFVWEHGGRFNSEIYYQRRYQNDSWEFVGSITAGGIIEAENPKLLIDSKNTLYCLFIADDIMGPFDGLFLMTKNFHQENWSKPLLIKEPENYAERNNYDAVIDANDTLHIVWGEQMSIYQNKLYYSYKLEGEQNFTSMTLLENSQQISAITPNLIVDSLGALHLTYTLIDRNVPASYIKYNSKPYAEDWLEEQTLEVATNSLLVRPLQLIDSQDTLEIIFLKKYYSGPYLVSDSILFTKKLGSNWKKIGAVFEKEGTNYHAFFNLANGSLIYIQHLTNLPTDEFTQEGVDLVAVRIKTITGWVKREILFNNPAFGSEPLGLYDTFGNNVIIGIQERRGPKTQFHFISRQIDTDNDNLGDFDEEYFGTNPNVPDSDNDTLLDGVEIYTYFTNPALSDTDWDNLSDGVEVSQYFSDPLKIDTDNDGLFDGEEATIWHTDPTTDDTDSDGLDDFDEIFIYSTDPTNNDTEGDGTPDAWEVFYSLDPLTNDSYLDLDNDRLTNLEEFSSKTNPLVNDTDGDALSDGAEVKDWHTDPLNIDTDSDTISDADEVLRFGTNPLLPDTDGDGFTDREEIDAGTDPLKRNDNPLTRKVKHIILNTSLPIILLSSLILYLEIRYRKKMKKIKEKEKNIQVNPP
ncbi:MAG: hypothetical protein K9W42_09285 [Candidatus Heimdallarchaeota archaeon]|nr:hypothetical protein [Candidatus Heimdallarchaeota archaeon]